MDDSTTSSDTDLVGFENETVEKDNEQKLMIGTCFDDATSFKNFLRTFAIKSNFTLKIEVSNKRRIVAVCSHAGCPWRVRVALCSDSKTYEVRKLEDTHSCPGVNRTGNKHATVAWVAKEIEALVKKNPEISPKQLNDNLENMYGLSLPYMRLWRAREEARSNIFGSCDESYSLVPALQFELINRNPGSHVVYMCDSNGMAFKHFFVSFKVSIDGFIVGCRHLVGLDACHLKSKFLGVLLAANALDGNNGLFTLAFAIAEGESKSSWKWFLENLSVAMACDLPTLAFISDMEKGLGDALKHVFPNAEHRVCVRHLWKNLKKQLRFDNKMVKSVFWSAANALVKKTYDSKMNELSGINSQIHKYLMALPYTWSRSQYRSCMKNYYNTNNMSESFSSWIKEARHKPAVDLIDMIRIMLMEKRHERKITSTGWNNMLVPYAEEYIREITTRKDQLIIRLATPSYGEVEGNQERHVVDIDSVHCSCGFWQLTGLPCLHAAAVINTKQQPMWHMYVDEAYHVVRYQMAYEGHISTMPGKEQWSTPDDLVHVGVPGTIRPRGRPKKKRITCFLEGEPSRRKSEHRCSRCGRPGHHQNTCKNSLNQGTSDGIQVLPRRRKLQIMGGLAGSGGN